MKATASRNTQLAAMPMMIESRTTIGKRNGHIRAEPYYRCSLALSANDIHSITSNVDSVSLSHVAINQAINKTC